MPIVLREIFMRSVLFCTALCSLVFNTHAANLRWQHQPGITDAGAMGVVTADLDADGRDEGVFTATQSFDTPVLGVIARDGDSLVLEQLLVVDGAISAPIIAGSDGAGIRILALLQQSPYSYALAEYGGRPLRELRRMPVPNWTRPLALADVDADGDRDILALVSSYQTYHGELAILDHDDGSPQWTDWHSTAKAVAAQLDADAPLELVIAGTPGRVLDGATRAEEWNYPPGFQALLFEGKFDNVGARQIVATEAGGYPLTIHRTSPYSPLREVPMTSSYGVAEMIKYDIDGDGWDELLHPAEFEFHGVVAFTPAKGTLQSFPQTDFRPTRIASGNLVGTAAAELLLTSHESYYNEPEAVRVVDSATNQTRLSVAQATGPYTVVAVADMDADGRAEVIHALAQPTEEYGFIRVLCTIDPLSGIRRRCLSREFYDLDATQHLFATGKFGPEAGDDVAVVRQNVVTMYDGATFEQKWQRDGIGEYYTKMEAGDAMRFNADAIDDIVLLDGSGKLHVLDGNTGATLWESVTLGGSSWNKRLTLANVDGDSAVELLASTGETLYAFDAQTRLLEWSLTSDLPIHRMVTWGAGNACRLALYNLDGRLRVHRCSDRQQDGPDRLLPANANMLRVLDPAAGLYLVASDGRILTVAGDDSVREWARDLGMRLGEDDSGVVIDLGGDRYDVIVGSDVGVSRIAIHIDLLFADAFE